MRKMGCERDLGLKQWLIGVEGKGLFMFMLSLIRTTPRRKDEGRLVVGIPEKGNLCWVGSVGAVYCVLLLTHFGKT